MAGVWTPSTSAIEGHSAFSSMVLRAPIFSMSCQGYNENLAAEKRFPLLCLTSFSTSSYFGLALAPESTSHKRTRHRVVEPICLHDSACIRNNRLGDTGTSSCTKYGNSEREQAISIFHTSRKRTMLHAEQEPGGGEEDEGSMQTAVEETKRLLSLQKELLDQMSERKRLLAALTEDLGNSTKQSGSKEGSGAANDRVSTRENQGPLGSVGAPRKSGRSLLPQSTAQSGLKPQSSEDPIKSVPSSIFPPRFREFPPSSDASSSAVRGVSPNIQRAPQHLDLEKQLIYPEEKQKDATLEPELELEKADSHEMEKPPPLAGANVMNVIVVASECAPWSKTGGLGDVVGSLPKALARRGHRVMVVVPRYKDYAEAWETGVRKIYNVGGQDMEVRYFHGYIDGVDFVFIDSPIFYKWADNIYGGSREDILARMVLLCKAAIEVPWHVPCGGVCYGDGNLVFIANDWHTALLPVYLKAYYHEHGLMPYARSILVIHNIAHQGRGPMTDFRMLGLSDHLSDKFRLYDPVGGEHMNIFYAGLQAAYRIVAVSHGYAWECQTSEGGWGLDRIIRENAWKLRGVVNGIDEKDWNPQFDECLKSDGYCNYSLDTLETGKAQCKAALQKELGLAVRSDVPVIGFIGRLDGQKGVDIIAEAMPWLMNQDLQLVLLGSGRNDLEDMLRGFEGQHREKVRAWVGFSVNTAHRITAGADILLMPSRFEPCGLNQLYAMQYGTVPVVHAVGGLRDTVQQFDPYQESGLGWRFDRADPSALIHALGNALYTYRDFKESWRGIQRRGMTQDLSWDNAAKQYEEVLVAAKYQW